MMYTVSMLSYAAVLTKLLAQSASDCATFWRLITVMHVEQIDCAKRHNYMSYAIGFQSFEAD